MSDTYYVRIRGRVHGPMEMIKLQSLVQKGQLSRIHEVSTDSRNWSPAATVPEIFEKRVGAGATATANKIRTAMQRSDANVVESTKSENENAAKPYPSTGQMEKNWHYMIDGSQYGPVSKLDLTTLCRNRSLSRNDLVWKEGMPAWGEAGHIAELASLFVGQSATRHSALTDANLAEPDQRFFARVLDAGIFLAAFVVGIILWFLLNVIGVGLISTENELASVAGVSISIVGLLVLFLIPFLLGIANMIFISTKGQTIGKKMMKIRIAKEEDDSPAGFVRGYLLRTVANRVIAVALVITVIGALYSFVDACWMFRDPQRRTLHDLLAKTRVIKVS